MNKLNKDLINNIELKIRDLEDQIYQEENYERGFKSIGKVFHDNMSNSYYIACKISDKTDNHKILDLSIPEIDESTNFSKLRNNLSIHLNTYVINRDRLTEEVANIDIKKKVCEIFNRINFISEEVILNYKFPKRIKLVKDKLIGRYFKVKSDQSELICRILYAPKVSMYPDKFGSIFLRVHNNEIVSCELSKNSIHRKNLLDPEITKEITEREFLESFREFQDRVMSLLDISLKTANA